MTEFFLFISIEGTAGYGGGFFEGLHNYVRNKNESSMFLGHPALIIHLYPFSHQKHKFFTNNNANFKPITQTHCVYTFYRKKPLKNGYTP